MAVTGFTLRLKSGGSGFSLCLETEDAKAAVKQVIATGAVSESEVTEGEEAYYGGKSVRVKDPYGFAWVICSPAKKSDEVAA